MDMKKISLKNFSIDVHSLHVAFIPVTLPTLMLTQDPFHKSLPFTMDPHQSFICYTIEIDTTAMYQKLGRCISPLPSKNHSATSKLLKWIVHPKICSFVSALIEICLQN